MTTLTDKLSPAEPGARLKVVRETANVTQDAGAKAAGIARTTLVAIEKGQRSARIDEVQTLSRCYGVSVNSLLRRESVHVDLVPRFRSLAETDAAGIVIPPKRNRTFKRPYDADLYKERNVIERFFNRLKQFRRVATRYDKLLANFMGFVKLAAIAIWLK